MSSNNQGYLLEGSLATTFGKAVVVAIADFMDDSKRNPERNSEGERAPNGKYYLATKTKNKLEELYWLGGDCFRATAESSLATISHCSTMNTDNTSDLTQSKRTALGPAIVSPCNSDDEKSLHAKDVWQSGSGFEVHANSNKNDVSRCDEQEVKDYSEESRPQNEDVESGSIQQISGYFRRYSRTEEKASPGYSLGSNYFCVGSTNDIYETEIEERFSIPKHSASPWCGGVNSYFLYNVDNEKDGSESSPHRKVVQDAKMNPQRQYAFDEDDREQRRIKTSGAAVIECDETKAYQMHQKQRRQNYISDDDGNSVTTGMTSVHSFMMSNRPHKLSSSRTSNFQQELDSHRKSTRNHLHQLIAPSTVHCNRRCKSEHRAPPQNYGRREDDDVIPGDYALSQSLMRKFQKHLPYGKRGNTFWLQYSLIRDGASLDSLLDMVCTTSENIHSVMAIETVEGEVFGAYLTSTWKRSNKQWFGGGQSFLWTTCRKNSKKKELLKVYSYSFANPYVQLCDRDRLLVGSGEDGFGLALEKDLLRGSTHPCSTFNSPSLSALHSDGSSFEIRNLEVWNLTAYLSMVENPSEGLTRVHRTSSSCSNSSNSNCGHKQNYAPVSPSTVSRNRQQNSKRKKNRSGVKGKRSLALL